MVKLFADRLDSFIRKPESRSWRKQSKYNYFTDEKLIDVISLNVERPVAISLDRKTHLAVLSVSHEEIEDRNSIHTELVKQLRAIGVVKPCSYVVNEFGDIHVYLCFDEEFDSRALYPMLRNWLMHCELDQSVILIGTGEPLELPLQKDFLWTTNYATPLIRRMDIATDPAIAMFLSNLSKGLLESAKVKEHLAAFPTILPPEPVMEEKVFETIQTEPSDSADEIETENVVSLARRRKVKATALSEEELFEGIGEEDLLITEEEGEDEVFVDLAEPDYNEDEELFEELLDFDIGDIPDSPHSLPNQQPNQYLFDEQMGMETSYRPNFSEETLEVNVEAVEQEPAVEQEATMLPPPGTSSFKQLTIPFSSSGDLEIPILPPLEP